MTGDVVIVDSGGANLASLRYALERLGARATVSQSPEVVARAERVLLPGVGSAAAAMTRLRATQLERLLPQLRQPVLGICLGMQLLYESSEEGEVACLGLVAGRVQRLRASTALPVPHMGWNTLQQTAADPLLAGIGSDDRMYFVHSYAAPVGEQTVASCDYGTAFAAAVTRDNFRGVQFHPERSGAAGARLLANFLQL